jgi:hypothetical protein
LSFDKKQFKTQNSKLKTTSQLPLPPMSRRRSRP